MQFERQGHDFEHQLPHRIFTNHVNPQSVNELGYGAKGIGFHDG
jgi:hypothetical protein